MKSGFVHTASILGASGYAGLELVRILLDHPSIELEHIYAQTFAGKELRELNPNLETNLIFETYAGECISDIYFLALPHGEALKLVPQLIKAGKIVIDLSGDYRLKKNTDHAAYYKYMKPADAWLTYGLPELNASAIAESTAVSNPGCYATSIILGLAPLALEEKIISVSATCISGLSGAGRTASSELLFTEMSENVRAYKIGQHQHTPEILQALNASFPFTFVPMVGPIMRGIYSVLTVQISGSVEKDEIIRTFDDFYHDAAFVRIRKNIPELRHITHTNFCDIHIASVQATNGTTTIVIISMLDNLLKGAAGQAVQNMNLMLGLNERTGLVSVSSRPVTAGI